VNAEDSGIGATRAGVPASRCSSRCSMQIARMGAGSVNVCSPGSLCV
jgi:hypothetical protein